MEHLILDLPGVKGRSVKILKICPCCGGEYDIDDGEWVPIVCPDNKERKVLVCVSCLLLKSPEEVKTIVRHTLEEYKDFKK